MREGCTYMRVSKEEAEEVRSYIIFRPCGFCKKLILEGEDFGVVRDKDGKIVSGFHASCFDKEIKSF